MSKIVFDKYSFYESGGSILITIPSVIVNSLHIHEGDEAVIWVDDDGRIVIEKKKKRSPTEGRSALAKQQ